MCDASDGGQQRWMVYRLRGKGLTVAEVARAADIHLQRAYRVLERSFKRYEGRPDRWWPAPGRLTLTDREKIRVGLAKEERYSVGPDDVGRCWLNGLVCSPGAKTVKLMNGRSWGKRLLSRNSAARQSAPMRVIHRRRWTGSFLQVQRARCRPMGAGRPRPLGGECPRGACPQASADPASSRRPSWLISSGCR